MTKTEAPDMGDEWRAMDRETMTAMLVDLATRSILRKGEDPRVVGIGVVSAALDWARDRTLETKMDATTLAKFRTDSGMDAKQAAESGSKERLLGFAGDSFVLLLLLTQDVGSAVTTIVDSTLDMAALNPRIKTFNADGQRVH